MEADMAGTSRAWAGWVLFAAVMLVLAGAFNIVEGLVALFRDETFVVGEDGLLVLDYTTWGVIMLLFGAFMIVVGLALNGIRGWARGAAVVLAGLHMIAQMGFLDAQPVWSVIVITLDVVVIYALTARWSEAVAGMESVPDYARAPGPPPMQPPPMTPRG
jgi:hypothetical protein